MRSVTVAIVASFLMPERLREGLMSGHPDMPKIT
jgi:hypothetical protein